MLSNDELQQIAQVVREELKPINERLDKVDERLDKVDERLNNLEEDVEIIKYSTNELIKWVDTNFRHQYPFPVDKNVG